MTAAVPTKGMIALPGRLLFADLTEPGGAPGFPPKYSATLQIPKEGEAFTQLWNEVVRVAQETWGNDANDRVQACWDCISQGVAPKNSDIGIQDGDLFSPEHNAGFYLVKGARRTDQGPPPLIAQDGTLITNVADAPRQGDGVYLLVNVWAMKKHTRLNFTIEGVRVAQRGASVGGPSQEAIQAGLSALSQVQLPAGGIPGVVAPAIAAPQTPQVASVEAGAAIPQTGPPGLAQAQPATAAPTSVGPAMVQPPSAPPQGPPSASMFEQSATEAEPVPKRSAPPTMMDL